MADAIILLCLVAPPLLMWWMVVVQRRTREYIRARREEAGDCAWSEPLAFVEEERGADGLSYGRRSDGDDGRFPAGPAIAELDGIKALEGRRC
jgi:hypothetical protein